MAPAADVAAALRRSFRVDPGVTKIHKLLYYCQGWHLTWAKTPMFPERIEAWELGPVVARLWQDERYRAVIPIPEPQPLPPIELRTVEYVVSRYGPMSATQLVGQTHQEDPWRHARELGEVVLSLEEIKDFFRIDPGAGQAWYWNPDWLEGEREADEDIRKGRTETSDSTESFVKSLAARRADAR